VDELPYRAPRMLMALLKDGCSGHICEVSGSGDRRKHQAVLTGYEEES